MDKNAQERGLLNKLREHANITSKLLEGINPKFKKMMDDLRKTDGKIRGYAEQSKDLIKSAKSLVNRRDYLSAASTMSAFHEKCRYIAAELDKFIKNVDMDSYEVLLGQFDDEQKERIFGYDPNKELNLNEVSFVNDMEVMASLQKQAGLSDWWHNLTNERATAMRQLEKRFSISFLKDLKNNSINIFNDSQRFLQFLLGTFKKLATALARGKPSIYISIAKSFISKFDQYHKSFISFYEKNMKPLKQQHEKMIAEKKKAEEQLKLQQEQAAQQAQQQAEEQAIQQTSGLPEPAIDLTRKTQQPSSKERLKQLDILDKTNSPKPGEEPYENIQDKNKQLPLIQSAHFISKIEKIASDNDPKSLMLAILKYSAELENTNPEASLKLLAIAEGIVEDEEEGEDSINNTKYYQMGHFDGAEDLKKYGFGSDILGSILSHKNTIPVNKEYYIAYSRGYIDGSKMKESSRNEIDKIISYIDRHSNDVNNASIFDVFKGKKEEKKPEQKEENKSPPLV